MKIKPTNHIKLPQNPKLKQRARELRKAGILAEVLFWKELKSGKIFGLDFDRQKIIGNYIVDFYCSSLGLVIEIDGSSHDNKYEYDKNRKEFFESLGLKVVNLFDNEVNRDAYFCAGYLKEFILENYEEEK
jgi:very-short-patch-repair endonuclease